MDVAELYLAMIRPTGVPVVGECWADGFQGQIQVERWNWNLMNDEEIKRAKKDERDYEGHREFLTKMGDPKDYARQADRRRLATLKMTAAVKARSDAYEPADAEAATKAREEIVKKYTPKGAKEVAAQLADYDRKASITRNNSILEAEKGAKRAALELESLTRDLTRAERDMLEDMDKAVGEAASEAEEIQRRLKQSDEDAEARNKSYEFSFSKRVDVATTQMLNSMKAGDVFPLCTLTIHQRSSNAGMSLVFTVTELRLLDYSLRAEVSDTMTDMKEQWKAEFRSLAYLYKNRKVIDGMGGGAEAGAKVATQGTVRTFAMKKDLGF